MNSREMDRHVAVHPQVSRDVWFAEVEKIGVAVKGGPLDYQTKVLIRRFGDLGWPMYATAAHLFGSRHASQNTDFFGEVHFNACVQGTTIPGGVG